VQIAVADTGQGIPKQYITKIFDRYFRIPGSKKEGTGLGLSISKEFIEAQGGSIYVESELAKGSTFIIKINKA
jgi:signal transduction histidine kinase